MAGPAGRYFRQDAAAAAAADRQAFVNILAQFSAELARNGDDSRR